MDYKLIDNDGFEKLFRNKAEARYYLLKTYGPTIVSICLENGGIVFYAEKVVIKNQLIFSATKKLQKELIHEPKK
jgi:hypothetical protein